VHYQRVKVGHGVDGAFSDAQASDGLPVHIAPKTSGGLDTYRLLAAGSNNAQVVKASAGQVYGIMALNAKAAVVYLKFFDKATAPVPGTDVPKLTIGLPANSAFTNIQIPSGIQFTAGIGICMVTGQADNDNTAITAADVALNVLYR